MTYYGTLQDAEAYFEDRLHADVWADAVVTDRPKALKWATRIIDALNFKGYKATVYTLLQATPNATTAQVRAAEASQELEFPRDADTEVPEAIKRACYEIAYSLLDDRDPEMELETLMVTNLKYGSLVGTTFERNMSPVEHTVNGVPSMSAWTVLKPFLRDSDEIKLSRVS